MKSQAGSGGLAYRCLGVDVRAVRLINFWEASATTKSRFHLVGKRSKKARMFSRVAGRGSLRLFTAGMRPAAAFGAKVVGMTNKELLRFQKWVVASTCPSLAGRSRLASLMFRDPTAPL